MRVAISFWDMDFAYTVNDFMQLFILPTFVEREPGHFVTHLTSSMIVELFNTHAPYIYRLNRWQQDLDWAVKDLPTDYLQITEQHVFWDNQVDERDGFDSWDTAHERHDVFFWTDGRVVYPTWYAPEKAFVKSLKYN